jgi:hypothetical protein
MFTIGDFATFTAVSVPALRLWDRLGLLVPASVDPEANGFEVAGGAAEISLVWDPENPEANVTELQLPLKED